VFIVVKRTYRLATNDANHFSAIAGRVWACGGVDKRPNRYNFYTVGFDNLYSLHNGNKIIKRNSNYSLAKSHIVIVLAT